MDLSLMIELLIAIAILAAVVIHFSKRNAVSAADLFCRSCGTVAPANEKLRGHWVVSFILYWLLIIPGIAYSIWRRQNTAKQCPKCGNPGMIPVDTPAAQAALREQAPSKLS